MSKEISLGSVTSDTGKLNVENALHNVPNRFLLSVAAAKRARQLKEGARLILKKSESQPMMPVVYALQEIGTGKIQVVRKEPAVKVENEYFDLINDEILEAEVFSEKTEEEQL